MRGPVACIDIDYFYAQAEELRNPAIKDKPVLVCVYSGRTADSGVVATCNYIARRFGVKSGIAISRAKTLLRDVDAVFLPVDMQYYSAISRRVFEIAEEYADVLEVASIDEAFLDLSEASSGSYENAASLMASLKSEVRLKAGLTCSVGVAKNKLLAKMAADDAKPDGLMVLRPGAEEAYLRPKPVKDIPYVGGKTAKRLQELGVETVGDLSRFSLDRLVELFGFRMGRFIYLAGRGEYYEQVTPRGEFKQLSRMVTLKRVSRDEDEVWGQLSVALGELHRRVVDGGYLFKAVSLMGITVDMNMVSRGVVLPRYTQELSDLETVSRRLLKLLLSGLQGELRRIGIRVHKLSVGRGQSKLTDFQRANSSEERLEQDDQDGRG
ncbi:MAG: DNA polymerase IV [Nitrososphaerota archaeon]|nr:DNA polymerase IV [Candidatus Calditenuaceae archaeon]MDW8073135.1 DNA polymerase IV [Nitrososphaerota archaeon]